MVELSMLAAELKMESRLYDVVSDTLLPSLSELALCFLAWASVKPTYGGGEPITWTLLSSLSAIAPWLADSDIMKLGYWLAIMRRVSLL